MLINGIELSSLGVELYDRIVYSNDIDTKQEWLDGDIQPTFIRQQDRFKNLKLDFLVLCANEDEAFTRISRLTAMLKKATVKFDDLNFTFDVSIINVNEPIRLKNGNFVVSYMLTSGYAKGQREVYTTNANMTNSFKLTLAYYKDKTTLLSTDTVIIRASAFEKPNISLKDLGIDVNKYMPKYYNEGIITNLGGADLTYENLQTLQALMINYEPVSYNVNVKYYMNNGDGMYNETLNRTISFTQPGLNHYLSIGQLVGLNEYRPEGYKGHTDYEGFLTVEDLLVASTISVYYDKLQLDRSKNILVSYKREADDGSFELIQTVMLSVKDTQFYDGSTLQDIVKVNAYRPEASFYNEGYIREHNTNELVSFDNIETNYVVEYTRSQSTVFVEYYAGTYPDWRRLATITLKTKYKDSFVDSFDVIKDLGIDVNKYHTAPYEDGILYNKDAYTTYEAIINAGVLQVFYKPIEYPITVNYYTGDASTIPTTETVKINATMFFDNPVLSDIIPIQAHRPDGYQLSIGMSYAGEVSLEALTQASPIMIVYEEITVAKTKNVIVKYKKELSSAYSTLATNLITVSEADCVGGIRLKDIISLNAYQPEYYDNGVLDGESSTALIQYDDIKANYEVMYLAKAYTTPVRYYVDEINDLHWVGSASISYRIIDFTAETTLFDFGLDLNAFKSANVSDGALQYTGLINFTSLLELASIDVLYTTQEAPPDPEHMDYPHRFLFLQHNDLGDYENLHPEWTMNHAYINTGITADDMSKLTVVMECERVDSHVPLHKVNGRESYLFGSSSGLGQYFMRFNNQTMYGEGLTGVNLYEAKAGKNSDLLILTEKNAVGFGENSGIYSSPQEGYSRAVFTYSNVLATDNAPMPYPLYLFANNNAGSYQGGLAGIGIYSCRIYYNDQLIRDFIPVSYYDKIGNLVAPSNCLYDKITNSFFEDATGLNSFNIRDDDRYPDENPDHKIGHCYVNYYKGTDPISTAMVWFRGSDFLGETPYDLYEKFNVDANQPQYTFAGKIQDEENIKVSFDGLNGKSFKVVYEPIKTQIEVNYQKQEADGSLTLIKQEIIPLMEKDFYQVPTFGDLVRLNKYKPDGYETDFKYTGKKVSLARVVEGSPYTIIYKPMAEPAKEYQTAIIYKKKVFGVRAYETIGTDIVKFDQSNFRDGEYIDFYIDFNKYKPEKYYLDGTTYHWFPMDERITKPEDLKSEYVIVYQPEEQFIDVNYYTDDETDEANMIASTSWGIKIDDLDPRLTYSLIDIFPNEYINKYKPVNCSGGLIVGSTVQHTFETLMALPAVQIVYETIVEPDDPEEAYYEPKVLGFGAFSDDVHPHAGGRGAINPYIDLGYRPKELGRLKVELKCVATSAGLMSSTCSGGFIDTTYTDIFGYRVPEPPQMLGDASLMAPPTEEEKEDMYSYYGRDWHRGYFCARNYISHASSWVYTAEGPQSVDGYTYYRGGDASGVIGGSPKVRYIATPCGYRKGDKVVLDENYEPVECFKEYWRDDRIDFHPPEGWRSLLWVNNLDRADGVIENFSKAPQLSNPRTIVLDAYHNYYSTWTRENSNHPDYEFFKDEDKDIFEARMQPKGSLSLFKSTNPITGKANIMPFDIQTAPPTPNFPLGLAKKYNPYTGSMATIEYDIIVQNGVDENNEPIYVHQIQSKNVKYAGYPLSVYPQLDACAIWSVKVWDRDRLVRDMIPVSKDQKVFNYIMPENGMFDLITEIFFGNSNQGGHYETGNYWSLNQGRLEKREEKIDIKPEDIMPFWVILDPGYYGLITQNYYDYDYSFINNSYVNVPTWYSRFNTTIEETLGYNDYKPNEFYLDGLLDLGDNADRPIEPLTLKKIYEMGSTNILYKLRSFTKTVVYYRNNSRVASKDIFYSIQDIKNAKTLNDLGIEIDLYYSPDFKHGRIVFDESILAQNNIQAFIDAPSPIVVYDKLTKEEAPNIFYVEYYRGGAYDDTLITLDPDNPNYLNCNLDGVVLNPNGAIKYFNHYHSALYEDEKFDYFIPYQVKLLNKYIGIHRGPARRFPTLAIIPEKDIYTIIEERNGWGRLKEYPVGWILLNATVPMTGPGQNPDYDVPNTETATIPFKTSVHITKLTIDRLWCYVPEVESWIKSEDISYNQSGKLYNALGLDVIHLDTIDFSKVKSLADIGIYPNKRVLYFHDRNTYVYNGDYSKEAFSALHELEFVYPETVYNYNCIYYKDNKFDGQERDIYEPGKAKTLISYYFYKTENALTTDVYEPIPGSTEIILLGKHYTTSMGKIVIPVEYNGNKGFIGYHSDKLEVLQEPKFIKTETIPSNELGRASFSCSIGDWNPDWDVFIESSWKVDPEGISINPTLYRSVPLTLDWDYFGFDKNLYRPAGYPEGIYMWNARTWEQEKISFTFEELIRCGTQYVFYPCFDPNIYKIWAYPGRLGKNSEGTYEKYYLNPGIEVNFQDNSDNIEGQFDNKFENQKEASKLYDIYTSGEIADNIVLTEGGSQPQYLNQNLDLYLAHAYLGSPISYSPYVGWTIGDMDYSSDNKYIEHSHGLQVNKSSGKHSTFMYNMSNLRPHFSAVVGFGNEYVNQPMSYQYEILGLKVRDDLPDHRVEEKHLYGPLLETTNPKEIIDEEGFVLHNKFDNGVINQAPRYEPFWKSLVSLRGIIYNAISYKNFLMVHYWVPVPKGLHYRFNGKDLRIPDNGLFDLLTGDFSRGFDPERGDRYPSAIVREIKPAKSYVFLKDQEPIIENEFNYFDGWNYHSTDVDYIVKTNVISDTYKHPDKYATNIRDIAPGVVFPVSKVCVDANNRVVGEWYFSGDQWLRSDTVNIYAGEFDKSKLTKLQQAFCIVKPKKPETYYVYPDPSIVSAPGITSDASYGNAIMDTAFYNYVDVNGNKYFFDGAYWVPEKYTSFNTTELNKNYAVVPEHIPYYSQPIESEDYLIDYYHYGDRLTVPYVCNQDTEWGYTGLGWVRVNNANLSEVK